MNGPLRTSLRRNRTCQALGLLLHGSSSTVVDWSTLDQSTFDWSTSDQSTLDRAWATCGILTFAGSWERHPENIVEREPDLSRLSPATRPFPVDQDLDSG